MKWWKKLISHIINIAIIIHTYCTKKIAVWTTHGAAPFPKKACWAAYPEFWKKHFNITWTACPEFRRDLQGDIFWTNWMKERNLFIASEFACRPWEKRTRRCIQMSSFKWRQCNASLCIFSGFEIRHTKKVFLLAFKRTFINSDSSTEEKL